MSDINVSDLNQDQLIFSLDIGTRSVVGVIGTVIEDKYTVLDYVQKFHPIRAMRDGQVEDIELVAKVCGEVKQILEERHGIQLKKVAVAAAGRALKTARASFTQQIPEEDEITVKMIRTLEYSAIGKAQEAFEGERENNIQFQCVGYSVLRYYVDDYPISNLEGQKGSSMRADIIAAFLPFSVVKSLYSVTARCGLEVSNLTLEPIAAINVIVPPDVRLLNIAIADIGAGTSDIAISKNGSIVAYDMATIAGDEISEAIMSQYLTDFNTAEEVKKALATEKREKIEFEDILGIKYSFEAAEILDTIDPTISSLAQAIAESIRAGNDGAPQAVFLIGGGSQIPGLCQKVAAELEMPPTRVALGGMKKQSYIDVCSEDLLTPEFVTPIGIGNVASKYKGAEFFSITVNGNRIMLMQSGTIKVLDALLLAGIKATSMIGRSSKGITYYIDGQRKLLRGSVATPGEAILNGKNVSLETEVHQGDVLNLKEAVDGKDPLVPVSRLPEALETGDAPKVFAVNGKRVPEYYIIQMMDKVEILPPDAELPWMEGYEPEEPEAEAIPEEDPAGEPGNDEKESDFGEASQAVEEPENGEESHRVTEAGDDGNESETTHVTVENEPEGQNSEEADEGAENVTGVSEDEESQENEETGEDDPQWKEPAGLEK